MILTAVLIPAWLRCDTPARHIILHRGSSGCVVLNHREIKVGTLSGVLKQAGITADEFLVALGKKT